MEASPKFRPESSDEDAARIEQLLRTPLLYRDGAEPLHESRQLIASDLYGDLTDLDSLAVWARKLHPAGAALMEIRPQPGAEKVGILFSQPELLEFCSDDEVRSAVAEIEQPGRMRVIIKNWLEQREAEAA